MSHVIRRFQGSEVQNLDHLYLKKDRYFQTNKNIEKQCLKEYSKQYSTSKISNNGLDREIRGRPHQRSFLDSPRTVTSSLTLVEHNVFKIDLPFI